MPDATPTVDAIQPLRLRRMRLVASVFFCVLTLAIFALWLRSYWWCETVSCTNLQRGVRTTIGANCGWLYVYRGNLTETDYVVSKSNPRWNYRRRDSIPFSDKSWTARKPKTGILVWVPYSVLVGLTAVVVYTIPLGSRLSLRSLFIATTLSAVVLGLGAWLAR
jgi:hypothetical protein